MRLLKRGHETCLNPLGNRLALHAFEDSHRLLGCVAHHKAVGTFANVSVKLGQLLRIKSLFQIAIKLLQKLLTGKQKRRLPFS